MKEMEKLQEVVEVVNELARSAVRIDEQWKELIKMQKGYNVKYGFFADLCAAEITVGNEAIMAIYESAMKVFMDDIVVISEFVLVLQHKAIVMKQMGFSEFEKIYQDLFHSAFIRVVNHYKNDRKATKYLFELLD